MGMQALLTLKDTVAENEVESLGETQDKVTIKVLDYKMVDRQEEVKIDKTSRQ